MRGVEYAWLIPRNGSAYCIWYIMTCIMTVYTKLTSYRVTGLFRQIGFSPQEDPLCPVITKEEHMECYAELRRMEKQNVETVARR